jgi:hypothetical protein
MINIQQRAKQMIVLPQDFYIREPNRALVSFGKNGDNNNKKVSTVKKSVQLWRYKKAKELLSKITLMISSYIQMSFLQRSP